jgi:GT2 family glycosyltransferase
MNSHNANELLAQVTVLVVTYNSGHCVPALARGLIDVPHVIVVDNASQDDTASRVRQSLAHAQLVQLDSNRGYGVANNAGLAQVQTPYALLLNPDCEIDSEDIAALVQAAKQWPDATLIVPQLVDAQGELQVNYSWPREAWKPRSGAADGPLGVGYACAAVMLINIAALLPVGGFDPSFFLYYEDEDLCLRVFQRHGQILVLPDIRVTHLSRGSVRGPRPWRSEYWRGYHHVQSKLRFMHKHVGASAAVTARRRLMITGGLQVLARAVLFSPKHLARAWGRFQGVRHLPPLG